MKLVRLRTRTVNPGKDQEGVELAIHPQLTVVLGTAGAARQNLIEAIAGIARGVAEGGGVIEVGGVEQDLTTEALADLGLGTDVDVVVRATHLPGHRADRAAERRAAAAASDEARRSLVKAQAVSHDASEVLDEVKRTLNELRAGRGQRALLGQPTASTPAKVPIAPDLASAERARLDEEVERLHAERDSAIFARAEAERVVSEARERAAPPQDVPSAARSEQTSADQQASDGEAKREELQRKLVALAPQDPTPIRECLDRIERARGAEPVAIPAALALADAWRDVHGQLADLERTESDEERQARARLEAARRAAVEAEKDLRVSGLPADVVAELESAHIAVLDAQDKSTSRFSGGRARSRLDHARAVERSVLAKLDFTTYADYMMSSSSRGVGAGKRAVLQAARIRVAEAEAELQELSDTGRDIWRADLLEQRSALAPRIALLLGHEPEGPEVEGELRALRAVPPADDALLADMRSLLAGVGVAVEDEVLGQEELVGLARTWLDENGHLDERRVVVEAELRAIDDETAGGPGRSNAVQIDAPSAADEERSHQAEVSLQQTDQELVELEGRIADLEAAVVAAEAERARLLEDDDTADQQPPAVDVSGAGPEAAVDLLLAETEARLQRVSQDALAAELEVDRLTAELASAEHRFNALTAAEDAPVTAEDAPAEDRQAIIEEIEWYLLTRLAAARSVGSAGSVPLVLDDPFHDLEVAEAVRFMEWIERMSAAVQVIAVTDDLALSFWAESLGAERAAVVSVGS